MRYLLGIDLGTSSAKALVMREDGIEAACAQTGYGTNRPQTGWAEQAGELLWQATVQSVHAAMYKAAISKQSVCAISVTGQMHGLVLLDRDGVLLRPVIIWQDQRSTAQLERIRETGAEIRARNAATTGWLLSSLLWVRDNEPAVYERVAHVLLPKDYIRYRLCGEYGTDFSDASGTLLLDTASETWDAQTLDALGISHEILPSIDDSCALAGQLLQSAGVELGLPAGLRVAFGGGDTPMYLLGNGLIDEGQLATNIGTSSQICRIGKLGDAAEPGLNCFRHNVPGMWATVGACLNGGLVISWLQNEVLQGALRFDQLASAAETVPAGCDGLVALPYFCGERSPILDPKARGVLFGLTPSHNYSHIARALMESVVLSLKDCLSVMEAAGLPLAEEVTAAGGGAKSALWLQMQADILNRCVVAGETQEAPCRAAAMTAGLCAGIYGSLRDACAAVVKRTDVRYEPDVRNHALYETLFQTYRNLYQHIKPLF